MVKLTVHLELSSNNKLTTVKFIINHGQFENYKPAKGILRKT